MLRCCHIYGLNYLSTIEVPGIHVGALRRRLMCEYLHGRRVTSIW